MTDSGPRELHQGTKPCISNFHRRFQKTYDFLGTLLNKDNDSVVEEIYVSIKSFYQEFVCV